jgi:enamine deaminase RidA (YjgF/YER057c/UK114 family)
MGIDIQPKFVSFDMNGTLIHYRQDETIRKVLGDRLPAEIVNDFELAGEQIRFDECIGDWRSMHEVIEAALRRTMAKFGVEYREGDARAVAIEDPDARSEAYAEIAEKLQSEAASVFLLHEARRLGHPVRRLELPASPPGVLRAHRRPRPRRLTRRAEQMSEIHTKSGSAVERLQALGLDLPGVVADSKYVNHRSVDSSIYVAGQLPYKDGELLGQGTLGRDVELETARDLARQAALNALAVAADAVGDLDRVRIVQTLVFVASTPEFGEQSRVADAASEFLIEVLGENGRHARTAIGVAGLPRNSPVEIQMVCTAV